MDVLGLIPARGGSKGILDKNLVSLAGKPLLAYTCEQALAAKTLSRVILSSEETRIIDCGKRYGVEVPFVRPRELAADDTPMIAVVRHALETLRDERGYRPDAVVVLQPTSPLRCASHVDEAVRLLTTTGADTVVSVIPLPHRFSPYTVMRCEEGWLRDFWSEPLPCDRFRRQDLPMLYARNGPAVLVTRTSVVLDGETLYGDCVAPYVMDERESVDIDTAADLRLAEWLLCSPIREPA